jgi:hypothetical protein
MITAGQRFPDLCGCMGELKELTHVAWSIDSSVSRCMERASESSRERLGIEVRQDSDCVIRSPKGFRFCGWKLGHHSKTGFMREVQDYVRN